MLARELGLELPPREKIFIPAGRDGGTILIHTGAGQPIRVWPLEHYRQLAASLRRKQFRVQIACDPDQRDWWRQAGETTVAMPGNVTELLELIDHSGAFIGNDSGPGHLAAMCGVPTFTLFGPQLPEWFAPLHPAVGMDGGQGVPLQAVLGLLPVPPAVLPAQPGRGGGLCARGKIYGQGLNHFAASV